MLPESTVSPIWYNPEDEKIIDVVMGKEPEYLTVGKTPLERVHKLLSKIDSIRVSKIWAPWFPRQLMAGSTNMWNR